MVGGISEPHYGKLEIGMLKRKFTKSTQSMSLLLSMGVYPTGVLYWMGQFHPVDRPPGDARTRLLLRRDEKMRPFALRVKPTFSLIPAPTSGGQLVYRRVWLGRRRKWATPALHIAGGLLISKRPVYQSIAKWQRVAG